MLKQYVTVRGEYEGFHKYDNAPESVAFLRNEHRHLFKWSATIEVFHDDRDLEFFITKREIEIQFKYWLGCKSWRDLGSCEMQARQLFEICRVLYGPNRYMKFTVSEDGESDGHVIWTPDSN